MLVAFHLHRRPVSLNARPNPGYARQIVEAALHRYGGPVLDGPLYSRILWFHKYATTQGDVDNIAKRIHDALKGVLFADDGTITRTMTARIDASERFELVADPNDPSVTEALSQSLADWSVSDILYIEVGQQTNSNIYLGPRR